MFHIALWGAKFYLFILKLLKKEKDDKPGMIACRLCPNFLEKLNKPKMVIGVSGTNGKTTTTNLIADTLKNDNKKVIYNDWGANTLSGYVRCLIEGVNIFNKPKDVIAIVEIDEVSSDIYLPLIKPNYLVLTNLFRDSMHRNANPDYVFNKMKQGLNKDIVLILNGDDPFSSRLGEKTNKCVFYGIEKQDFENKKESNNLINDFTICPKCFSKLEYDFVRYHHIGKVHCPNCSFKSKTIDYLGIINKKENCLIVKHENESTSYKLISDSIINLYNEIAVITLLSELGYEKEKLVNLIEKLEIPKSRYYSKKANNIEITTMVSKGMNAIATSRALDYVSNINKNLEIVLVIDDQFDNKGGSEAIAWIYDSDFEFLNKDNIKRIVVGGVRSRDYKLRLLLAGVPKEKIYICNKELDTPKFVTTKDIDEIIILHDVYFITGANKIRDEICDMIKGEEKHEN